MAINYNLPPNPQHAVLKRIYPWDEYNVELVMQWLFAQARKTGFTGTFEDFKLRYGAYVEAIDPQEAHEIIENYTGTYHIIPLMGIEQVLKTKNKVLNQDIIIDPIPDNIIDQHKTYTGRYQVIPMANVDQILRTNNRILEQDMVVEKIPYAEVSNTAGGVTCIIG